MPFYGPIIFCCLHQVIDFGVHKFEDAFLSCFLVAAEFFCGLQYYGPTSRRGRASSNEELLKFGTGRLKVFKIYKNLHDLPKVLRPQFLNERSTDLFGKKLVERLEMLPISTSTP